MKNYRKWALLENGYIHTDGLSRVEAEEMLARYNRFFEHIEYSVVYLG